MRDRDIRHMLHKQVLYDHADDPSTVVVDELGILQGATRADIAVVNGMLHAYEIKSERDNLARLPRQVELYGLVFDRVTLVTVESHISHAVDLVPEWWELAIVRPGETGTVTLQIHRPGLSNDQVQARAIAELLWRDEALELLTQRNADRGVRSRPRRYVWDRLCEVYTLDEIKQAVRDCLKRRKEHPAVPSSG